MASRILDQYGKTYHATEQESLNLNQIQSHFMQELRSIKAKYDAAATTTNNENHWANADQLDPHSANSLGVRRLLRSRSRYEIVENNPYLKGCILTLANDFVGKGPKLQIIDDKVSKKGRKQIEDKFEDWMEATGFIRKLWRMRVAKIVDGETFAITYNRNRKPVGYEDNPITLDFYIAETDRITSPVQAPIVNQNLSVVELDGVRWDKQENPLSYYMLDTYPGYYLFLPPSIGGKWIDSRQVVHWFRQDRGWLRGIPELTPSLPLCALLRRYTLAVVRSAEFAACFSGLLESELPPGAQRANVSGSASNPSQTDLFQTFPVDHGMFTVLPWGYKLNQLKGTQPMAVFGEFVDVLLREIVRPIHIPFNLAAGTSKDANMSSALLDIHVYKGGQAFERGDCDHEVLSKVFSLWFQEAITILGYLPREARIVGRTPKHQWRWDKIGLDHTDPEKVANALKVMHDKGFITDRDVQESEFNRSVEDWQNDLKEGYTFRKSMDDLGMVDSIIPEPPPIAAPTKPGGSSTKKSSSPPKKSAKASRFNRLKKLTKLVR